MSFKVLTNFLLKFTIQYQLFAFINFYFYLRDATWGVKILNSFSFLVYKLGWESTQLWKMRDQFWQEQNKNHTKDCRRTINSIRDYGINKSSNGELDKEKEIANKTFNYNTKIKAY